MNSKFISFALSILTLSIILSAVAHPDIHEYNKRLPKLLSCPCKVAKATFDSNVFGQVIFAQDNSGGTLVTGFFSEGMHPERHAIQYYVKNSCGKLLYNMTSALNVKYRKNGTYPFSVRLNDFNLNCNSKGVLLSSCKRHHHKRQAEDDTGSPSFEINSNGDSAVADIE
ncbi:11593_t:CDS:1 [Diversispora eburnea]|uniref:11593_t:CDS:1 n=1 Tax=Diversispora eburnea TaxID=1213867 RepID=A0A9N9C8A9_9GLOM|nr:11593_t:CDS:1 [Diversispora eburnea]